MVTGAKFEGRRPSALSVTDALALKTCVGALLGVLDDAWPAFLEMFFMRPLKRGEFLVRAGQSSEEMGFVARGLLRTYYERSDGSLYIRHFSPEGTVFGAFGSRLTGAPSNVSIDAIEDTEVASCRYSDLEMLYAADPRWQVYGRRLAEQLYVLKERRESQLLMMDAEERYCDFLKEFGTIETRLKQRNVASYLGITPESLSRIRKALRQNDTEVEEFASGR